MNARNSIGAIVAPLVLAAALSGCGGVGKGVIEDGVRVAGGDVGGLRAERARAVLRSRLGDSAARPLSARHAGERISLPAVDPGIAFDVRGLVKEALRKREDGTVRLAGSPHVTYSREAIAPLVESVRAAVEVPARDARLVPAGAKLHKAPAHEGITVRLAELEETIVAELALPGSDGSVEVPVRTLEPEVTQRQLAGRYPEYVAIDRSGFRLRLYKNLELAKTYTIAVGQAGYDTPTGTYEIQSKQVNPTWSVPNAPWTGDLAGQSIPPGPGNPLKARWMGFLGGAGIHGTDELDSLGTAVSHGCIRMAIPDVIELYDRVEIGTPVQIT